MAGGQAEEWAGMGTHRVADRLEEEQREETSDACTSWCKCHGKRKGGACDAVEAQHECWVDEVEEYDTDESAGRGHCHPYGTCAMQMQMR